MKKLTILKPISLSPSNRLASHVDQVNNSSLLPVEKTTQLQDYSHNLRRIEGASVNSNEKWRELNEAFNINKKRLSGAHSSASLWRLVIVFLWNYKSGRWYGRQNDHTTLRCWVPLYTRDELCWAPMSSNSGFAYGLRRWPIQGSASLLLSGFMNALRQFISFHLEDILIRLIYLSWIQLFCISSLCVTTPPKLHLFQLILLFPHGIVICI